MAMKRTHDVCATVGEYESGGETKHRKVKIGSVLTDDANGRMSIVIDEPWDHQMRALFGPKWSGWLSVFEARTGCERNEFAANQGGGRHTTMTPDGKVVDEDLPFG